MRNLSDMQARLSQKAAVSVVYVSVMFMSIMDTSIVNVALPSIARHFRIAATAADGVSIAFLVSLAVFIPASGWLGDRFGGKRVLMTAVAIFTIASALCGVAAPCSRPGTQPPHNCETSEGRHSEQSPLALDPAHGVIVQDDAPYAAVLGQRARLWFDRLRSKHTFNRGQ